MHWKEIANPLRQATLGLPRAEGNVSDIKSIAILHANPTHLG